jgi:hypothetical protein
MDKIIEKSDECKIIEANLLIDDYAQMHVIDWLFLLFSAIISYKVLTAYNKLDKTQAYR